MWCWVEFYKIRFRRIDYLIITSRCCICQWEPAHRRGRGRAELPGRSEGRSSKKPRYPRFSAMRAENIAVVLAIFTECTWGLAAGRFAQL